jgi:site-specific DNA recombinase
MRPPETKKALRCAVYTRVSTEYGLEQEFNSLDAQRESSEAYVKSQAHEGWRLLPTQYNDGGFSGGSLNRPALQKLLSDIRDRLVDIVVVYKVDRLTRSLADFAKLVELFDAQGVSFVSVTQAFNTTTSMGRLTLNVLLSFAQFEREVTGERIRDKVAASKRKGMRMGGPVPLGYDVKDKKLVINPEEAERVRTIFRQYLKLKSITKLLEDLRRRKILTKRSPRSGGSVRGGISFTKGALAFLLKNRVYVGEVVHKGNHYAGEHPPILDRLLFEAVQHILTSQAQSRQHARVNTDSLLTGKIFDDRGNRMTPSSAKKGAVRYRYYVSAVLTQGRKREAGSVARVSAPEIEAAVIKALRELPSAESIDTSVSADVNQTELLPASDESLVEQHLERVTVRKDRLEVRVADSATNGSRVVIVPWAPKSAGRKRQIVIPRAAEFTVSQPVRTDSRARFVESIARARRWLTQLTSGEVADTRTIALREGCSERSVRMTISLAFLNPMIVERAIDNALPRSLGLSMFTDLPADWQLQAEGISC